MLKPTNKKFGKILNLKARQILDSRGLPTVESEVTTKHGLFSAIAPSGASTGLLEAFELRDNDAKHFHGKSVHKAVQGVNTIIKPALLGKFVTE